MKNNIKKIVREVVEESLLSEYITRDEIYLRDYLSMTEEQKKVYLPHEYHYFFEDFLVEDDVDFEMPKEMVPSNYQGEPDEEVDMFEDTIELMTWLENNNKEVYDSFANYLYRKITNNTLPISSSEYPAWSYFDDSPQLVKNQWLIHFTSDADGIYRDGFKYGVGEMERLGLTTELGEFEKKYGGYNFAYLLSDFVKYAKGNYTRGRRVYKYGDEAVIYRASGIKVWHHGDEEPQVIFYGNTATDIIPLTSGEDSDWSIKNKNGRVIFEDDDLERVVIWVAKNYQQYRKSLSESREIVREIIKEEVIEETQVGQKDLEKFADDILKLIADGIMREKARAIFLTDNKKEPITAMPIVNTLMMSGDGFSEIEEFVNSTNIRIAPTSVPIRGRKTIKGELEYGPPNKFNEEYYKIWLKYSNLELDAINEILNRDDREVTTNDVHFKLFFLFYSTLLHELQHAYDAWRSKGKAFGGQLKKSYTSAQEKANMLMRTKSGYDELTPEEIDALNKSRINYLNLVHEINARYAQAMQKISLKTMDFKTFDDIKEDWNKVYRDFKLHFDGWEHLSDKMKKKLTRRLAKAYQEISDELKTAEEKYSKEDIESLQEGGQLEFEAKEIIRDILKKEFIISESNLRIDEAIDFIGAKFLRENEEPSPTFEWDFVKSKIDDSKKYIKTKEQAQEYLSRLLRKIKSLPKSTKIKIAKYAALSLISLLGYSAIRNAMQANDIEMSTEMSTSSVYEPRKSSDSLVSILKSEEGSPREKGQPVLSAYKLGDGMITIGWGHAERVDNSQFRIGQRITRKRAEELFAADLAEAERGLNRILDNWKQSNINVEISQSMYDAMVSMIFNMGIGNFRTSEFIQLVKRGKLKDAAEKILTTNITKPGHVPRRKMESDLFSRDIQLDSLREGEQSSLSENEWYHGTPDVRELEKDGGFTQRYLSISYVEDIEEWDKRQELLRMARESGDDKKYFDILDTLVDLKKTAKVRKPIFITDIYSVAKTYADPQRAFDYQGAEEKVLKVKVKSGNGVTINAPGSRFRFIDVDFVKRGFINAGVDSEKLDKIIRQLNYDTKLEKGIKTDNIAAIGDWLGFDYIDVNGVLDSYQGGSTKSTVRMVFDPSNIAIIKDDNSINEAKEIIRGILREKFKNNE